MFLIHCPYCCEHREEDEIHAVGQAHLPRPLAPDSMTDEEWGNFVYYRKNPRGEHRELWVHAAGCRKYFNIARNTQTYEYRKNKPPITIKPTHKNTYNHNTLAVRRLPIFCPPIV